MIDDRRSTRRAQVPGVRAVCVGTKHEQVEADVLDIGRGGMFVRSFRPIPAGQRLAIDLFAPGEAEPWSIIGRIIWTRETGEGPDRPPGMGIKIVVADDFVADAIERLVDAQHATAAPRPAAPPREKTVLGVGGPSSPLPAFPKPAAVVAPAREATILGVGGAEAPSRERSLPIGLVSKSSPSASAESAQDLAEAAGEQEPAPARRSGGKLFILLLLAAAAGSAYVFRDRLVAEWREWEPRVRELTAGSPPTPTPTSTPTPTATPTPIVAVPRTLIPSATPPPAASKKPPPAAPAPVRHLGAKPDVKSEDNPY